MYDTISVNAHAKINPALNVTGLRADGYHEVRMLLQQIELHDVIHLNRCDEAGIKLKVINGADLPQPVPNDAAVPSDASNLACRAARVLTDACGIKEGVEITLEKNIPAAAGLAGGSADAAAVLHGMNELFSLRLPEEKLREYGLLLGADVPFCIMGGCALAEGIGEILTPLPLMPPCSILLVKPPEGISTGAVYHALDAIENPPHPDIDAVLEAFDTGSLSALSSSMGNILESVTFSMLPRLSEIRDFLLQSGACGAMMSGSGPTMFGIYPSYDPACAAKRLLKQYFPDCLVILTKPIGS